MRWGQIKWTVTIIPVTVIPDLFAAVPELTGKLYAQANVETHGALVETPWLIF